MRAQGKGSEGSEKMGGGGEKKGGAPHPPFFKKGGARSTGTPLYTLLLTKAKRGAEFRKDNVSSSTFKLFKLIYIIQLKK